MRDLGRDEIRESWERRHDDACRARAQRSTSSAGWLLDWLHFGLALGALTMATLPLLQLMPRELVKLLVIEGHTKALPLYALAYAVPMIIVPRLLVDRAFTREMKWAMSLPFSVEHYEEQLGTYPSSTRLTCIIEFVDLRPTKEQLAAVLEEPMVTWDISLRGAQAGIERSPGLGQRRDELNRRLHAWFHPFVEKKLLPLHAQFPIRSFVFAGE